MTTIDYGISSEPNAVAVSDSARDDCEADEDEIQTIHGNSSSNINNAAFVIRVP